MVGLRDSLSNIEHRFGFGMFNSGSFSLVEDCRSYMFENSLLRRIYEHSLKGIRRFGEICVMRAFVKGCW
jgi:hypothetical protein